MDLCKDVIRCMSIASDAGFLEDVSVRESVQVSDFERIESSNQVAREFDCSAKSNLKNFA
jgi:hypothetical protein